MTHHHDLPDDLAFPLMRANRIKEQEVGFVDDEVLVASIYEPDVGGDLVTT